jgi:predicted nuclease with TOPRIM domain
MTDDKLDELFEELKRQRDELRLQIHLARAEARSEWEKLEARWDEIRPRLDMAARDAANTGKEMLEVLEQAAEVIRKGYQRIRSDLS